MQTAQTQASLNHAHLLLEEGESEAARTVLDSIRTDNVLQQRDVMYLLGWYYVVSKQWDAALQTLSPLLAQNWSEDTQDAPLERERLAIYLLRLGQIAVNLAHYEDASQHFLHCLKLLHDRRIHLPAIRIEARYNLALTYIMRGSYSVALSHYEDALRLCRHYGLDAALPNIYYGLSEAYRCMKDFPKAQEAAYIALHMYEERKDDVMQSRMYIMLGRIALLLGEYERALDLYTTSYTLANVNRSYSLIMLSNAMLAEIYAEKHNIDEARVAAQRALEATIHVENAHLCGIVYLAIGKVSLTEARLTDDNQRQDLFNESIAWLQKSLAHLNRTQAFKDLAQAYSALATAYEEAGRQQEALTFWKLAFTEKDKAKDIPCGRDDVLLLSEAEIA